MPKLPSPLANAIEKEISKVYEVTVENTIMLSDHVKKVILKGDFPDLDFVCGNEALFKINANESRHYAITDFSRETNTCQVIFYLNGKGIGSSWAMNLQTGDCLKFITDHAQIKYDFNASQHFFFGDETSIGLYESFGKITKNLGNEYFGILEMKEENHPALENIRLLIDVVPADTLFPAENAIEWMENMHPKCWEMWKDANFYLTGRSKSLQRFKQYLLNRGVEAAQIQSACYWESGRTGG